MNFTQTMNTAQTDHVQLNPVDGNGNPQPLATTPTFTMGNGATGGKPFAGTVTPDANGLGATVAPTAADTDTFTLTIFAQGDPKPGVDDLTDTVVYTITAPEDITLGTVVAAPTNNPVPVTAKAK